MAFDAHDLDLNQLILCRNLLQDEVIHHIAHPADTPEEFRSEAAACAARLIHLAETRGLGGNLMRTYLLYLLVHEKNLAAQAVEEFAKDGQIGAASSKPSSTTSASSCPCWNCPPAPSWPCPCWTITPPPKCRAAKPLPPCRS